MNLLVAVARRDLLRVLRRPGQVIATVLTPLLVWGLFASGLGDRVIVSGLTSESNAGIVSGSGYYLVGAVLLVVAMASVFSSISLIEDRDEGVLRALVVSPAPRWALSGGKFIAATLTASVQALPLLAGAMLLGDEPWLVMGLAALLAALMVSTGVTGFGLAAAARSSSTRSYHGLVNLVLMPAWALSGALFPIAGSASWVSIVASVNPMAWAHEVMTWGTGVRAGPIPVFPVIGLVFFAAAGGIAATYSVGRSEPRVGIGHG